MFNVANLDFFSVRFLEISLKYTIVVRGEEGKITLEIHLNKF